MLSLLAFTSMRTIATQNGADVPVPVATSQSVAGGAKTAGARSAPAPRVEDVPRSVANALADGKVVVLLFAEGRSADDLATGRHFNALSQLGGGVRTFRAGIDEVGRYAGIVAELGVTQAPAIVIVRPDLRAVPPLEGYVESQYLVQRVRDQLR
jgi:hypothetical protein